MSCVICAETFNKSNRLMVKCRCDFECCRSCIKTYLLDKVSDACCMECKVSWDRKFMVDNFEKSFINKEYKINRENVLFEREMGMLESTQCFVEREIKLEKLNVEMDELRIKLSNLSYEFSVLKENVNVIERKKFVRKCPNNNCHGFLNTQLKCEMCECKVCSECREIKGNVHICNEEILMNVKFLEKDSKGCPKCSSLISKVSGCDQMYCIECHTAFSWNTLKIENGVIHNPHFFDYQRATGYLPRNTLDIQCGRELDDNFCMLLRNSKQMKAFEICRQVIHIRYVEQRRFHVVRVVDDNLVMRINFMRNKVDEITYKKSIQRKEKDNQKKTELTNVTGMYINCMTDIMYRLIDNKCGNKSNELNEMEKLREYTNKCFSVIGDSYNSKKYYLNTDFVFVESHKEGVPMR